MSIGRSVRERYCTKVKTNFELSDFIAENGGYWEGEHPSHYIKDWQSEVANGDTRMGYWEWAYQGSKSTL